MSTKTKFKIFEKKFDKNFKILANKNMFIKKYNELYNKLIKQGEKTEMENWYIYDKMFDVYDDVMNFELLDLSEDLKVALFENIAGELFMKKTTEISCKGCGMFHVVDKTENIKEKIKEIYKDEFKNNEVKFGTISSDGIVFNTILLNISFNTDKKYKLATGK